MLHREHQLQGPGREPGCATLWRVQRFEATAFLRALAWKFARNLISSRRVSPKGFTPQSACIRVHPRPTLFLRSLLVQPRLVAAQRLQVLLDVGPVGGVGQDVEVSFQIGARAYQIPQLHMNHAALLVGFRIAGIRRHQ